MIKNKEKKKKNNKLDQNAFKRKTIEQRGSCVATWHSDSWLVAYFNKEGARRRTGGM